MRRLGERSRSRVKCRARLTPYLLVSRADVEKLRHVLVAHPEHLINAFGHLPETFLAFPELFLRPLSLGDVLADACGANDLTGRRAQHRVVPANQTPSACLGEYCVFIMPGVGQ